MRMIKVSLGLAILVTSVFAVASQPAGAQADSFMGTWVLNVEKSRYSPGPPPKTQTLIYEAAGEGVKVTAKGIDAAGNTTSTTYTANYDGQDYKVSGNRDWDMISLKRVNPHTVEFTRKKAGKIVQTGSNVVSKDGKTRTITATGIDSLGRRIRTVGVYERK